MCLWKLRLRVPKRDYGGAFYEWETSITDLSRYIQTKMGGSSSHFLGEVIITIIITARPANISCHGCRDGRLSVVKQLLRSCCFALQNIPISRSVVGRLLSLRHSNYISSDSGKSALVRCHVSLASNTMVSGGDSALQSRGFCVVLCVFVCLGDGRLCVGPVA